MDGPLRRFGEFPWRDACPAAGVGKPGDKVRAEAYVHRSQLKPFSSRVALLPLDGGGQRRGSRAATWQLPPILTFPRKEGRNPKGDDKQEFSLKLGPMGVRALQRVTFV